MAAISYKCPNCGGDLRFDPKTQKFKCEYCISTFDEQTLQTASSGTQEGAADKKEQAAEGAVVYSCPSCGAEIITDETTAATFCYYCHNPVVLSGRLSGKYEPDLVIPFAVDKKEAVESFLSYVKKKRFVPKDFFCKEQIEKISGVYFPFWVYSCQAEGTWQGRGNRIRVYHRGDTEFTQTKIYDVVREAEFQLDDLTREALDKENRQLVEAVQPFRLEEAQAFSMGYLSGFQAEKRNLEQAELLPQMKAEAEKSAGQMLQSSISGYDSLWPEQTRVHIRAEAWKYLLLPVWVLTYRGKDNRLYYYAMNGQTKKISGILPVSKKRMAELFFGIFFAVLLFLLTGGYFVW